MSLLTSLLSLASAGVMMLTPPLENAAPQHDIDGTLFLINRSWRVSRYYTPPLLSADVPGDVRRMQPEAAHALEEMFLACKEEIGVTLKSVSGYRSYSTQDSIYRRKLKNTGSRAKADEYVARPGSSEHQLGLAMDVGQKSKTNLTASFGSTKGGKWVKENCWRFGFIIRYGEGWEDVTGYKYEPWHVRYVGKEAALQLHEQNMPMETWLLLLREETLLDIIIGEE